jgi:hypothetical protein
MEPISITVSAPLSTLRKDETMTLFISEHYGTISYVYGTLHVVEVLDGIFYTYRHPAYGEETLRDVWEMN